MKKEFFLKIFLLLLVAAVSIQASLKGGDFDIFLDAANKLSRGENIYGPPFLVGFQYYYSVFFALILCPFSKNVFFIEFVWSALSLLLLYRTFRIMLSYFNLSSLSGKQQTLWKVSIVVLSIQFILYNTSMIQVTMFLLWGIFESLRLIERKKSIAAGILLGLIINIKIMPVLILPYLFYRGHFRSLITSIIVFISLLYLPAIFIGFEFNQFLLSEWWKVINPSNNEHAFETGTLMHGISALVPVYFTETPGEMNFKRNFMNLSTGQVEIIIAIFRFLILTSSLFFLRSLPFKKEKTRLKLFWEFSYFVFIIPLLFPHQHKYAFLLAIPLISYLTYFFISELRSQNKRGIYFAFTIFCLSMISFSPIYGSDVIGRYFFRLTQDYKLLTIASLLVIPVAIYCSPGKIKPHLKNNYTR